MAENFPNLKKKMDVQVQEALLLLLLLLLLSHFSHVRFWATP